MVLRKLIIDSKSQLDAMIKDDVVVQGTEIAPEVVLRGELGPEGWQHTKKITIDHTKVEANLINFPVLISVIDTDLKKAQASGNDFLFTASDKVTQLSHEIDKWDSATGELIAWVKVPSLSSITDTILYLFYNNPEATDQQDITGTWDTNFMMVQHLKDDPDNAHTKDSTINANDGTKKGSNEPQEVDGIIGKAQDFDGVNDYIEVADDVTLKGMAELSISLWANANTKGVFGGILSKMSTTVPNAGRQYLILFNNDVDKKIYAPIFTDDGRTSPDPISDAAFPIGIRRRITLTYNGTTAILYIDATAQTITGAITGNVLSIVNPLNFGIQNKAGDPPVYFDGIIDEVRISDVARSPEWIKTDYNNQSSPDTFVSWGAEEVTEYSTLGTLTSNSEKIDAITLGMLRWVEELPAGTDITFSTRTGPTAPPDESWSAWSEELTDPVASQMASPPDIYIQFRVTLTTTDTAKTPKLYRG